MAKRRKLSTLLLEDLPDELVLKSLSYLEIPDLIRCGQVSKRIRAISQDESLWQKINLYMKRIQTGFLQYIINNGCQYLSLHNAILEGERLNLNIKSKLKYLDLSDCQASDVVLEELLASCHLLQKLSLNMMNVNNKMIKTLSMQNGQTLKSTDFLRSLIQ